MTGSIHRSVVGGGTYGLGVLIVGQVPVVFMEWARRAGSLGKLSALGLGAMAALAVAIATAAGITLFRVTGTPGSRQADVWLSAFVALSVWFSGVLTLTPGLVFLRLTDDRSLNDYGARFFLEWTAVYLGIAAAAFALGRLSRRSLQTTAGRLPRR